MSKPFEHQNSPVPPQSEPDAITLIKRMQQQLVYLERKIDTLISQSSQKPSRPFGNSHRHDKGKNFNSSGERGYGQGRHFRKHRGEGNQGFGHKKTQVSHFSKRRDSAR